MKIHVFEDEARLAHAAGELLFNTLKDKPDAVICIASGNSPKATCAAWVEKMKQTKLDTQRFFFIGLDEWVGIDPDQKGTCRYDFMERILIPLQIPPRQYHLFDGMAADLQEECRKMDAVIASKGGIDLMIVGIGMNGHIGFNEPGTPFHLHSHIATLDEVTTTVGQQYFDRPMALKQGITLGPAYLQEAGKVLLLAQGEKKAAVIRDAVEGAKSTERPATILQEHPDAHFYIDRGAASGLLSMQEDE